MDRRIILTGLPAVGAALLAAPAFAQSPSPSDLVGRFAATLTAHDMRAFGDLFADDYVNHQASAAAPAPAAGVSPKQGTVGFFSARLKGLPDLTVSVEAMVATQDMCAASFVYEGRQTGLLLGVAPTGKAMRFTSCDIFRVAAGRFVEHWGMGDIAGQMAQLKG